jgi:MiaB/RimO family radical SAM methylthiotransferase
MKAKSKRVYLQNDGCARRSMDTHRLASYFRRNGWTLAPGPREADLIVLATCGYTHEKANESLRWVERLSGLASKLLVTGCLPAIEPERLAAIFSGPVIHPSNLAAIDKCFPDHQVRIHEIPESNRLWAGPSRGGRHDMPFYVKIGEGCLGRCAFCAIRKATGGHRSKSLDECLDEVRRGLEQGYRRFHLVSEDVGAYGLDLGLTFVDLLSRVLAIDPAVRVKFDDFRPLWAVRYLGDLAPLVGTGQVYHILSPIQSGNQQVLRAMGRFSDVEGIRDALQQLKEAHTELRLVTNCIVGFPTETPAAFRDTLALVGEIRFDAGRMFPYSPRENTAGAGMEEEVSEQEVRRRLTLAVRELERDGYDVDLRDATLHFVRGG